MKNKSFLEICCLAAITFTSHGVNAAGESDPIRLGVSLPLTSPLAVSAKQFLDGAQACFGDVNLKGGIRGRKIELLVLDDKFDPVKVVENSRELLQKQVVSLFGYMGTPGVLQMGKFTSEYKIPLVGAVSGSPAAKDPNNKYLFVMRASFQQEAAMAVNIGVSTGTTSWGVVYQEDASGKAALDGVVSMLQKNGLKPAMAASFVGAKPDFTATIKQVAEIKPSALFFGGNAPALAGLVRAAKEKGVVLPSITSLSLANLSEVTNMLGDAAVGLKFTQPIPYPFNTRTQTSAEYARVMKAHSREQPSFPGMEGYLAAKLMVTVLDKTPSVTPERIVATLESMKFVPVTPEFLVTYGPGDCTGSKFVDMLMIGTNRAVIR